jgi:ferritin-like metal-binding protein YciE
MEDDAVASTMRDLLETALQDAYSAETQILEALPEMEEAASSPSLKQAFQRHRQETEQQVKRLEQACQQLGIEPEGETCEAMEGLVEEGESLIDDLDQGPVLDAALIGAAQKVEHYEIAAYGTLATMLKAMGQTQAAELMAQTLQEEKRTDEMLTQLAEQEVNPAALRAGGGAANDPSGSRRGAA